jgi:hypothetical protein
MSEGGSDSACEAKEKRRIMRRGKRKVRKKGVLNPMKSKTDIYRDLKSRCRLKFIDVHPEIFLDTHL